MPNRTSFSVLFSLAAFGLASPAAALDCGTRLVTSGDAEGYVRSVCGEPDSIATRTESHTQFAASPYPGPDGRSVIGSAVTINVTIDVWTYDFGRTRFMEELVFADGHLRGSRPLGYGTVAGDRRRRDSLERRGSFLELPGVHPLTEVAILTSRRRTLRRS